MEIKSDSYDFLGKKKVTTNTRIMSHIQSRTATQEEATSSGVLNPRHFLGRLLINDSI
jgi:hypothetical protein